MLLYLYDSISDTFILRSWKGSSTFSVYATTSADRDQTNSIWGWRLSHLTNPPDCTERHLISWWWGHPSTGVVLSKWLDTYHQQICTRQGKFSLSPSFCTLWQEGCGESGRLHTGEHSSREHCSWKGARRTWTLWAQWNIPQTQRYIDIHLWLHGVSSWH